MDITKFSLYTALAIITYLMLLAWNRDYPPTVNTEPQTSIPQPPQQDAPITPTTPVPAVPAEPAAAATEDAPVIEPALQAGSRLINITTDTFELSIDLNGGDIVYLALRQYLTELDLPDPFVILESSATRSYVAQSGLIGRDGPDANGRAQYQASADTFTLQEGEDSLLVDLRSSADNVTITKRFTFHRGSHLVDLDFLIDNRGSSDLQVNPYGQIRRSDFPDPSTSGGFGRTFLGFVTTSEDDPYIDIELEDVGEQTIDSQGGWIGFSQHYFLSAWIPAASANNRFTIRSSNGQYFGGFASQVLTVPPGGSGEYNIQFYAGPKDQYTLAEIAENLNYTIDYGFLWFLAAPIYAVLTWINSFIGNFGLSIILLTVLVKALFYKLSESQYRSMAGMRRLMPKMQQLKESYGDDRMKLQQATMDLYKKEKVNPLGGCLPVLVQMPVFLALYWVLMESVELRHAPFFLYVSDLSVRDPFFILPLLMGATMYLQTSMSPAPPDPMQAKVMKLMPVMMTAIFLWFPAGLVLYWLTNGLLGILQQWYITKKIEASYAAKKGT